MSLIDPMSLPPYWLALPFLALLAMIALGPLFFSDYWHRFYPRITLSLALFVVVYYWFVLENRVKPIEALAEYTQFISLIGALYMATGGVFIQIDAKVTPGINSLVLFLGAIFSNLIGTTGASLLFIRPYIRLNKGHIAPYHIIFFIFIVSNLGGALTPVGDPPLFLGFLKGVPFCWAFNHHWLPWSLAIMALLLIFYLLDTRHLRRNVPISKEPYTKKRVTIVGKKNFMGLVLIMGAVFLDPTIFSWLPTLTYQGHSISFVREVTMILLGLGCFSITDPKTLKANCFSLEPLREICFLFVGIFGTMMPALDIINSMAQSELGKSLITPTNLYWGTGFFSSVLDNAPTYLNFLTASMAAQGARIAQLVDVQNYASGVVYPHSIAHLRAISMASVFFGAMTYIGNGPNFMVKAIAEQERIHMPSFGRYIYRFSLPYLLPVLYMIWLLFF